MVETKFQTSFIPKQPVTEEATHSSGGGLLFLIGFLCLIIAGAGSAGVFIWNKTLVTNIAKGEAQLQQRREAFDDNTIKTYTILDKRIDVAESLLKKHVKASALFAKIAENTLKTVQFDSFNYKYQPDGPIISMAGQAADYESMALQAKRFTDPSLGTTFRGPIFSSFSKTGNTVIFTFSTGIDPFVVDYYKDRVNALGASTGAAGQTGAPASGGAGNTTQAAPVTPAPQP